MIVGILQARVSSTRLPGKVLMPLLGAPMLARQIERIRRTRLLQGLVVATSTDPSDDDIEALCRSIDVACFRGDLKDVLNRYYRAAKAYGAEHIVRLTGDCPLADPQVIDQVIDFYTTGGYDHASNGGDPPTFPDGLDTEIFRFSALEQAWKEALLPSEREHVTPFIYKHPERFRLGTVRSAEDLSALRWTVDEPADFALVHTIYQELYPLKPDFDTHDILALLEARPELKTANTKHARNEGYARSLQEDAAFVEGRRKE